MWETDDDEGGQERAGEEDGCGAGSGVEMGRHGEGGARKSDGDLRVGILVFRSRCASVYFS